MEIFDYINGKGGLMLLGLIALLVLLYQKHKARRYFKYVEKKRKEKGDNL